MVADEDGFFGGLTKGSFVGFGRKDGKAVGAVGVLGALGPFLGVASIGLLDLGFAVPADDGCALLWAKAPLVISSSDAAI